MTEEESLSTQTVIKHSSALKHSTAVEYKGFDILPQEIANLILLRIFSDQEVKTTMVDTLKNTDRKMLEVARELARISRTSKIFWKGFLYYREMLVSKSTIIYSQGSASIKHISVNFYGRLIDSIKPLTLVLPVETIEDPGDFTSGSSPTVKETMIETIITSLCGNVVSRIQCGDFELTIIDLFDTNKGNKVIFADQSYIIASWTICTWFSMTGKKLCMTTNINESHIFEVYDDNGDVCLTSTLQHLKYFKDGYMFCEIIVDQVGNKQKNFYYPSGDLRGSFYLFVDREQNLKYTTYYPDGTSEIIFDDQVVKRKADGEIVFFSQAGQSRGACVYSEVFGRFLKF